MFWDDESKNFRHNVDYLEKLGKYYLVLTKTGLEVGNLDKINNMVTL